jgi:epoxyqueuosine reductase
MNPDKIFSTLQQSLKDEGYRSSFVSTKHLHSVQSELARHREQGTNVGIVHGRRLSQLYDFNPPRSIPNANSLIVTAARQPKFEVRFHLGGKTYPAIIPPTYYLDAEDKAPVIISSVLSNHGFKMATAAVPVQALAIHSGLVSFGKNNVTFIDGWGSYFRLRAFFSDLPCLMDDWQEPDLFESCEDCDACVNGCPNNAIVEDRFAFREDRCLSYLNEGDTPFPSWVDPSSHNCLIGCMRCQDACPANKNLVDWVIPGAEFLEDETTMIVMNVPIDDLPRKTLEKLKTIHMLDDYNVLGRNIRALMGKL